MFIFGARSFHPRRIIVRKTGAKIRRQKMEPIYGADFWSVCHGYNVRQCGAGLKATWLLWRCRHAVVPCWRAPRERKKTSSRRRSILRIEWKLVRGRMLIVISKRKEGSAQLLMEFRLTATDRAPDLRSTDSEFDSRPCTAGLVLLKWMTVCVCNQSPIGQLSLPPLRDK